MDCKATSKEMSMIQRRMLFALCEQRKEDLANGIPVASLDKLILRQKAEMMEEDVDWVMARVAELP